MDDDLKEVLKTAFGLLQSAQQITVQALADQRWNNGRAGDLSHTLRDCADRIDRTRKD